VLVAVAVVRVVQVITNQVVHVLAVGHRFVTTPGAVLVLRIVLAALVVRRAPLGVLVVDVHRVLVDVAVVRVVQVTVVEVIHVVLMADRDVSASALVLVVVTGVLLMVWHSALLDGG
jgi:hypothetical protein